MSLWEAFWTTALIAYAIGAVKVFFILRKEALVESKLDYIAATLTSLLWGVVLLTLLVVKTVQGVWAAYKVWKEK